MEKNTYTDEAKLAAARALREAFEGVDLTGNCRHIEWPQPVDPQEEDPYPISAWEEHFDHAHIDAMLHILHHITKGLPRIMRRWILRRASTLPHLRGQFAPNGRKLGFFADDSPEMIGMSSKWIVYEDGTRKQIW